MWELKNSKQVEKNEHIRFRCTRCAACCQHVKGSIVIEGLDAYRLARHLGMETADFMSQYTKPFILDDKLWYPIFSLRVKGNEDSCIFLKGTRCTVQEAKPRTCRLYPFWVEPNEPDGTDFTYHICFEHRHHPKGSLIRVLIVCFMRKGRSCYKTVVALQPVKKGAALSEQNSAFLTG